MLNSVFFSVSLFLRLTAQIPTEVKQTTCVRMYFFFERHFCILNMHRDRIQFHKEIYFLIFMKCHSLQLPSCPPPPFVECKKYFLWFYCKTINNCKTKNNNDCKTINNMRAMMKRQLKHGLSGRGQSEKELLKWRGHVFVVCKYTYIQTFLWYIFILSQILL